MEIGYKWCLSDIIHTPTKQRYYKGRFHFIKNEQINAHILDRNFVPSPQHRNTVFDGATPLSSPGRHFISRANYVSTPAPIAADTQHTISHSYSLAHSFKSPIHSLVGSEVRGSRGWEAGKPGWVGGRGVKWCRLPLPHSERSGVKLQVQRVGGLWPRLSIAQSDGEEDSGNCRSTERTGGQVGRHGRTDSRTGGQPDSRMGGRTATDSWQQS